MTPASSAPPPHLRTVLERKPVLWVGADLNRQADPPLPTLWQLARGLADAPIGWRPLPDLDDPYALFDRCLDEGIAQPGELHDYLESWLRPEGRDPKPGALHEHLAALAYASTFPFIVDPNDDLLLRRVMQGLRTPHTHSVLEQNLARLGAGCWHLSIHGDRNDWLHGLERRVYDPTLIEKITVAGRRIVEVVHEYDSPELFAHYEELEFEVSWVREPARQLADQARALVVNEGRSVNEATALLLETAWAIVLSRPAPVPGA
jgi:hypothetical protein